MTIDDLKIGQAGTIAQVGGEVALRLRFLGFLPKLQLFLLPNIQRQR